MDGPCRQIAWYVDRIADRRSPNLDAMRIYRLDRFGRGGHLRRFNDSGFTGVRIMEAHEHCDRKPVSIPPLRVEATVTACPTPPNPRGRSRRPSETPLYPVVQHHLETFHAEAQEADPMGRCVPVWVERDFRTARAFCMPAKGVSI